MDFANVPYSLTTLESNPSVVAFQYDFLPEKKAEDSELVSVLENGDLLIEGYAAVFEGLDREGENFTDGAFEEGIKAFINGQAALCYHHKHDLAIGRVLELEEHPGRGLWMKARVDHQKETSPIRWIYDGIRKNTINGLSAAGFFGRINTENGPRINKVDLTEISTTPVPTHPGTKFAVVAQKALAEEVQPPKNFDAPKPPQTTMRGEDVFEIQMALDTLDRVFAQLKKRSSGSSDEVQRP
jgi:HK97 family phage prohead protease